MSEISTAEGFENLCRQTADKWKSHDFRHLPGSSGNVLTKFWTTDNMAKAAAQGRRSSVVSTVMHGVLGVGLAITAVPFIATFAPVIIGVAAGVAILGIAAKMGLNDHRSKSVSDSEIKKIQKAIPLMQEDLTKLLDESKAVAQQLRVQQDKKGVKKVRETLDEFLKEEMAIEPKGPQLDKLLPDRKGVYDFTGLQLCLKTRKVLEKIESDTKAAKVIRPQQHNFDPTAQRGQSAEPPTQGFPDLGRDGLER